MKKQTFGYSDPERWYNLDAYQDAVRDYLRNRKNGEKQDRPNHPFPNDGEYEWIIDPAPEVFKKFRAKYTEGPKDRAWMEEMDRNYLERLSREKKLSESLQNNPAKRSRAPEKNKNSPRKKSKLQYDFLDEEKVSKDMGNEQHSDSASAKDVDEEAISKNTTNKPRVKFTNG